MAEEAAPGLFVQARGAVAVFGLLVLAAAALLSGSDRQSKDFPNSPSFVGWPYDTGAARAKAANAFVRSGPASAIALARRSILSDPISAQAVSLLGRSELYAQHLPEAQKAFVVSGQLGWRDPMTQIYWLDQALQGSDYKVAAERLDALLRQSPDDENRDRFIAVMASTPEGRAAMATRLKLAPQWARVMVINIADLPDDQLRQRVDLMLRTGSGVWDCPATQLFAQKLINQGLLGEAQSVWRLNCGSSDALVYDGRFEHFDTLKATFGFDWQVSNRGDAEIAMVDEGTPDRSLALEVTATVTLPIVRQLLVLKPGRYRLTWRTPGTDPALAQALQVSLGCQSDLSRAARGIASAAKPGSWSQDFTVDGECPAQQLVFWLAPHARVRLGDVALSPIGGASDD
ncbi:hypothetical protein [Novosphingobium sp.]|uniref:hypothetical protein n=1 Tax=Novosphingobium sp. TaxID=1874826 RepID=UPI0026213FF3|nr:hypothetical protein [Novosphingobium sp.]